jgi:hypothetical protein
MVAATGPFLKTQAAEQLTQTVKRYIRISPPGQDAIEECVSPGHILLFVLSRLLSRLRESTYM